MLESRGIEATDDVRECLVARLADDGVEAYVQCAMTVTSADDLFR